MRELEASEFDTFQLDKLRDNTAAPGISTRGILGNGLSDARRGSINPMANVGFSSMQPRRSL